jgi:hypothetical protein
MSWCGDCDAFGASLSDDELKQIREDVDKRDRSVMPLFELDYGISVDEMDRTEQLYNDDCNGFDAWVSELNAFSSDEYINDILEKAKDGIYEPFGRVKLWKVVTSQSLLRKYVMEHRSAEQSIAELLRGAARKFHPTRGELLAQIEWLLYSLANSVDALDWLQSHGYD